MKLILLLFVFVLLLVGFETVVKYLPNDHAKAKGRMIGRRFAILMLCFIMLSSAEIVNAFVWSLVFREAYEYTWGAPATIVLIWISYACGMLGGYLVTLWRSSFDR